jgi:hypothetical protein
VQRCTLARWMAVVFIVLTACISLAWSHAKLLSQDEMYAFQTDRVPTFAELVKVQKQWPISLDPILYHAMSHIGMQVVGVGPSALRFPSFLGFLLMQVCLFFFVRNLAGDRAGAVAAALPALTVTLYYSAEGRPYGFLLGMYALALLCWQVATREAEQGAGRTTRTLPLVGLALALAAALNAHYFGILLLVPLWGGEAWRTYTRRRVDWPVVGALVAGMAAIGFTEPFMAGAAEFKKHYYNAGGVGLHDITRAYRSIFLDYTKMPMRVQHIAMVLLVAYTAALVWGCWRVYRARRLRMGSAEWVAVLLMAALPFGGYLLARFVTHSIEVRYVLGALVALSIMTALAAAPYLRHDAVFNTVLVLLGVGIVAGGAVRVRAEQRATDAELSSLVLPPNVREALNASPTHLLYIQDMGTFEIASYYEPDPVVRAAMTLVYSENEELRWDRHNTMALTAEHMEHFAGLCVQPYDAIRSEAGAHVFLLQHSGWDWTDEAFAADHATVTLLGKAAGADAASVQFAAKR